MNTEILWLKDYTCYPGKAYMNVSLLEKLISLLAFSFKFPWPCQVNVPFISSSSSPTSKISPVWQSCYSGYINKINLTDWTCHREWSLIVSAKSPSSIQEIIKSYDHIARWINIVGTPFASLLGSSPHQDVYFAQRISIDVNRLIKVNIFWCCQESCLL